MTNSNNSDQRVKQIQTFVHHHDDTVSVSVVFSDDSEWSGTVDTERYELMKQEELIYEVENVELLESDPDLDLFTFMTNNNHIFGLCAWCKNYFTRSDGKSVFQLTSEEFEMTTHKSSGVGHSCCDSCNEKQIKELKEYRDEKKMVINVNPHKGNTMKRVMLTVLVAAFAMSMAACSSPVGPAPTDEVIEYPQIKGMDIPDTNQVILDDGIGNRGL